MEREYSYEMKLDKVPQITTSIISDNIQASSKEEAEKELRDKYEGYDIDFIKIYNNKSNAICAIIFLSIAVFFTFFKWMKGFDAISLFPNPQSLIFSFLIYSGLVIRTKGLDKIFHDKMNMIISVLFICLFASVIKILLNDTAETTGIIGKLLDKIGLGNSHFLLIAAILLSWLGMNAVSRYVYLVVFILGFVEIGTLDNFMGSLFSTLFLLASFMGFVFFFKYEEKSVRLAFVKATSKFINSLDIDGMTKEGEQVMNWAKSQIEKVRIKKRKRDARREEEKDAEYQHEQNMLNMEREHKENMTQAGYKIKQGATNILANTVSGISNVINGRKQIDKK